MKMSVMISTVILYEHTILDMQPTFYSVPFISVAFSMCFSEAHSLNPSESKNASEYMQFYYYSEE
jgi:hypothetical protein